MHESADELLRDSDLALYRAKATQHGSYVMFEPEMQAAAERRVMLEMELAHALERNQLVLRYQPIFNLQSEAVVGRRGAAALAASDTWLPRAVALHRRRRGKRPDSADRALGVT